MEMAFTFLSLFSSPPLPPSSPSLLSRGALKQVALAVPLLVLLCNAGMLLLQFRITKSHVGLVKENEECFVWLFHGQPSDGIQNVCIYRTSVILKFCGKLLRKICLKTSAWREEETLPIKGS